MVRRVPTLDERAAFYHSRGTSVAEQVPRRPKVSNIVRLWFGTWKLVAMVVKKLKERNAPR